MEISKAVKFAESEMKKHNLTNQGWIFELTRSKTIAGQCFYDEKKIKLSKWFVELNQSAIVKDVILHELAHALVGYREGVDPHDFLWRHQCLKIGAVPRRYLDRGILTSPFAYVARCEKCEKEFTRYRLPNPKNILCCNECAESKKTQLKWEKLEAATP